jgi:plastocyanin
MNRVSLLVLTVVAALVAIVPASLHAEAGPSQQPSVETLIGTVRSNATIDLRRADGSPVTQLQAGAYAIEVHDESASHNFHLNGPGVDQATQVSWSGTVSWTVTLSTGTYGFQCDPHSEFMRGSFTVGGGPAPPPPPPPPSPPPAPPATPGVMVATARSNYTIDVRTPAGQKVDTVRPGPYTIEVRDQSNEHNFHLQGPNVNKTSAVAFVGTQKWAVTLSPGSYRYQCDPHATVMKGVLTVTQAAARKTKVSAFRVRRLGRRAIVSVKVDQAVSARIRLLWRSKVVSGFSGKLRPGTIRQAPRCEASRPVPCSSSSHRARLQAHIRTPSALLGGGSRPAHSPPGRPDCPLAS